jgi:catechol 2,3-dioxygenase-like lactoylglutathione lyase family enzyme
MSGYGVYQDFAFKSFLTSRFVSFVTGVTSMQTQISPMLAVSDGNAAIDFYKAAFGAELLWHLEGGGHVVALAALVRWSRVSCLSEVRQPASSRTRFWSAHVRCGALREQICASIQLLARLGESFRVGNVGLHWGRPIRRSRLA